MSTRTPPQDHTPPTMTQFCEFLNACAQWLSEGSRKQLPHHPPIVVHCRGGKGRTGSMCCAWLLYIRECDTAEAALELFARNRTEFVDRSKGTLGFGHTKLQGVDTPSQRRYVQQLHRMLSAQGTYFGRDSAAMPRPVVPPQRPRLRLSSLMLSRWFAQQPEHKLLCILHLDGEVVFTSKAESCNSLSEIQLNFDLEAAIVTGDVRVSVFDAAKHAKAAQGRGAGLSDGDVEASTQPPRPARAGKEPGCLFYFLFHSAFVDLETGVVAERGPLESSILGGVGRGDAHAEFRRPPAEEMGIRSIALWSNERQRDSIDREPEAVARLATRRERVAACIEKAH